MRKQIAKRKGKNTHFMDTGVKGQIVWRKKPTSINFKPAQIKFKPSSSPKERVLSNLSSELQARAKKLDEALTSKIENNETSEYIYDHLNGMEGQWRFERSLMHKEIINSFLEEAANVPNDRKAIIAGGLGGSGKSTTLASEASGIDQSEYLIINPDDIKEKMIASGMGMDLDGFTPIEGAALIHEESSHIAQLIAQTAYAQGKNVIWDITMSSTYSVQKRIDALEDNGYNTQLVFVDITSEDSANRAMQRWERGLEKWDNNEGHGGRYVPVDIILKGETSSGKTVNKENFENIVANNNIAGWSLFSNEYGVGPNLMNSENWNAKETVAA